MLRQRKRRIPGFLGGRFGGRQAAAGPPSNARLRDYSVWVGLRGMLLQPLPVDQRRDLGRLDFRSAAPEDICVGKGNPACRQMSVDCCLVLQQTLFFCAVRDGHEIDVAEFRSGFSPITVGKNLVPAYFASSLNLHALRDSPVKQSVESGDADTAGGWFDMLEKGRKSPDYLPLA